MHSQASAFISLSFLAAAAAAAEAATLTPRMCGENKKDGVEEKWGERQGTKSGKKRISQILFKNFLKNQTMTIKGNATWGKVILICDKTLLNARKTYLNRRKRGGGGGESKK